MNMNLKGKIGRLPEALREEVNSRLRNGETGRALAGWLNSLPEVQAVLAAEFGGKPVREQNVSEWRLGGHQQWLRLQEAHTLMQEFHREGRQLDKAAERPVTETLGTWLAVRYVVAMKRAESGGGDPAAAWNQLRECCHDLVALRRVELAGARAGLAGARREHGGLKMEDGRELATGKSPEPAGSKACPTPEPVRGAPQREDKKDV